MHSYLHASRFVLYALAISLLTALTTLAASPTFDTYQRVKNITAEDSSVGSVITLGRPHDEMRHLIFVYNTDNREHTYVIQAILPKLLTLDSSTTEHRTDDGWKTVTDIDQKVTMRLHPFEHAYYRFTTHLAHELPNENLILVTAISVTDDESMTKTTSTKVYIPYFDPARALSNNYSTVTKEDEPTVKRVLDEERTFMESEFAKLVTNANREQKTPSPIDAEQPHQHIPWSYYIAIFGTLLAIFTLYHLLHHDNHAK